MDKLLEKLKEYGADVDGAMGRFVDDVELYKSCFDTFLEDEAFQKLGSALEEGAYEKAFDYAHTLKGIAGNMGMTPLYQVICVMVEKLRKKEWEGLLEDYAEVSDQVNLLRQWHRPENG